MEKNKVKPKTCFVSIKAKIIKIYYENCFAVMSNYLAAQ